MESRKLPDWISSYMEYTENSEPPRLFRKWCAASTIAAALQRKCRLEWGTTTYYPNIYVVLTAPAGRARKGTSMAPAKKFLARLGIPMAAEAVTREALTQALKESETVTTGDGGVSVHSSLTVFSPELTVFLGYNNTALISTLTDWYDCADKWVYRTKNSGTDDITGVFINLLGATTPDLIRTSMPVDAIGGGLTSRIIFVYEEAKGKLVPLPFLSKPLKDVEDKLYFDLEKIHMLRGAFKLEEAFLNEWVNWYTAQDGQNPFGQSYVRALDGYIERRPTQLLKLSMIMSASRSDEMIIRNRDFQNAKQLLEETEIKMPNVFLGVGSSESAHVMGAVMKELLRGPQREDSLAGRLVFDANASELSMALNSLRNAGHIKVEHTTDGAIISQKDTPKKENSND